MDRKLEKKRWGVKRILWMLASFIIILLIVKVSIFSDHRSKLNVDRSKISISTVKYGVFQEYISVLGTVMPRNTRFLDAIEPGIIMKIHKQSGELVNEGDPIIEIGNSGLELNVMTQESALYERISILRNTRLQLDQNNLNQLSQLEDINYQINILRPQYERTKVLMEKKLTSQQVFEQIEEQYFYNLKRKKLFLETYKNDSISREIQIKQINDSEKRMQQSLDVVRKMLEALIVRAPIDGQLSTPDMELGQSITIGERLGQIDEVGDFKVRLNIDEHYLTRINLDQKGSFEFDNKTYSIRVAKIYPTIINGTFSIDMFFIDSIPKNIKAGQNLITKIELGNSSKALLLDVGGFYNKTGGNWVYKLTKENNSAEKRYIKIGRRNLLFYEVLEGLSEGDKVITSSYELFGDNELLILSK